MKSFHGLSEVYYTYYGAPEANQDIVCLLLKLSGLGLYFV